LPSEKFVSQLQKIFHEQELDTYFVKERCDAAYQYFFKALDQLAEALLLKIEEVKRLKKVKELYDDLAALETLQIKAILQLKKAQALTDCFVEGKEISKKKHQTRRHQHLQNQ